jgi:hypothetical protein
MASKEGEDMKKIVIGMRNLLVIADLRLVTTPLRRG